MGRVAARTWWSLAPASTTFRPTIGPTISKHSARSLSGSKLLSRPSGARARLGLAGRLQPGLYCRLCGVHHSEDFVGFHPRKEVGFHPRKENPISR